MNKKFNLLEKKFLIQSDTKILYEEIINFGRNQKDFPKEALIEKNLVEGCQSLLYLTETVENGKIIYYTYSESLFSNGLASILTYLYSNEDPKEIFLRPPTFLKENNILTNISLNRQVGLMNLLKQMQLRASKYI